MNIEKLLKELQLSPEQYTQLKHLDHHYYEEMDEMFAFDCDGKAMWKALRRLSKAKEAEIKLLLNPSQQQRYTQMRNNEQLQIRQPEL